MFIGENDIFIVYSKEIEVAKYLSQTINEYNKKNEGVNVKASIYNIKQFEENQITMSSNNHVIYVGNNKDINKYTEYMDLKFADAGLVIKGKGSELQIYVESGDEKKFFEKYAPKYGIKDYRDKSISSKNTKFNKLIEIGYLNFGAILLNKADKRELLLKSKYNYLVNEITYNYMDEFLK